MSGPEYPRSGGAGSNAIGKFIIGESPIGDLSPFDVWTTILSQYANSDTLTGLIVGINGYIDQTKDMQAFFDLIWNVDTAEGYGLDVWGRIVGVDRVLEIQTGKYFGFQEQGADTVDPFDQSPFYDGVPLNAQYILADIPYRKLVFAKALFNITDGSIPAINQILSNLFGGVGRPNCYVTEGVVTPPFFGFVEATNCFGFDQAQFYDGFVFENMVMTYTFDRMLTPVELAIVQHSNVLPKPTGVLASIVQNY